jgi:hypothetical protein
MRFIRHTINTFNVLLLLSILSGGAAQAQGDSFLNSLTLYESEDKVYINTVINAGNICSGITILRSSDSLNFDRIGDIPGDCGSLSVPVSYIYVDENPIINVPSYYRVELGGYGLSEIVSILVIDTRVDGFQIRPNPASSRTTIFFENKTSDLISLQIYSGQQLKYEEFTRSNYFELLVSEWESGVYFFRIAGSQTNKFISGKIMVAN